MNLRTTTIDGRLVDIISEKDYQANMRMYYDNPAVCSTISVEVNDDNGNKFVLPFRNKTDERPGIYSEGSVCFINLPKEEDRADSSYNEENLNIIDFGNTKNIEDFLDKNAQIREMETNVLTDIDSVFTPPISGHESAEMKAFKEAVTSKHIDINKYQARFGDNFLNDKRILKTDSITMNKLVSMCKKLDIEAELTLRNVSPDVPNPMKKEITVILTGGEDEI